MINSSPSLHTPAPADTTFLPGPVLLLGAPGVGKGTQAQILMGKFGIPQISTGDLLRDHVSRGTALGKTAKALMDEGKLVSDEVMEDMVALRLQSSEMHAGYILDGFPRTLRQASWLDHQPVLFRSTPPLLAISIHVPEAELLRRITGRRTCPTCKRIFNIYSNPPRQDGLCDVDGSLLIQRSDDTESAFFKRMQAYQSQTQPVIDHYHATRRFREIDGQGSMESVTESIVAALRALRLQFPSGKWNALASPI